MSFLLERPDFNDAIIMRRGASVEHVVSKTSTSPDFNMPATIQQVYLCFGYNWIVSVKMFAVPSNSQDLSQPIQVRPSLGE